MSDTYKPGDIAPKTGQVKCTQHHDVTDNVVAGREFPPCMHWHEHDRKDCTWEYV